MRERTKASSQRVAPLQTFVARDCRHCSCTTCEERVVVASQRVRDHRAMRVSDLARIDRTVARVRRKSDASMQRFAKSIVLRDGLPTRSPTRNDVNRIDDDGRRAFESDPIVRARMRVVRAAPCVAPGA
ncbi:hypothetical protein [Cupriavidus pauculus]|uniref:hypothetical protein n=1 Tax=Cupriavidus pauculus TaxID=82633 RepID=UPI001FD1DF7D|nr:hypothetical protein [Cupriavidus pauculus]